MQVEKYCFKFLKSPERNDGYYLWNRGKMLINDEIMYPCGNRKSKWERWFVSLLHFVCLTAANEESSPLFLPHFSLLFCFFLSVKLCCFMKEEIILETSCLQFVPKTRAPSPKQAVEGGRCWGRCVVWAGPHQGPQRWAPSWSQGTTGGSALGTTLTPTPSHRPSAEPWKKSQNFLFNIPWTRDPVPARGGAHGKRDTRTSDVGFPTIAHLKLLLTAIFRVTSDTLKRFNLIHFGS